MAEPAQAAFFRPGEGKDGDSQSKREAADIGSRNRPSGSNTLPGSEKTAGHSGSQSGAGPMQRLPHITTHHRVSKGKDGGIGTLRQLREDTLSGVINPKY